MTPQQDEELGRIIKWLKETGQTAHVTLNGHVTLREKDVPTGPGMDREDR